MSRDPLKETVLNDPAAHVQQAMTLHGQGRLAEAIAHYEAAAELRPGDHGLRFNLGNLLLELNRPGEALAAYDRAVALAPGYVAAHNNRAGALLDLGRTEEALAAYDRVLALEPRLAPVITNRGRVLYDLGRMDEALADHDRALALAPGDPTALWNKSLALLAEGRLAEGFALFEQRKAHGLGARDLGPEWRGGPVAGKTLFLHAEQGLGDTLQFARYAPLLAAEGAKVILAAPETLHPVLRTLGGDMELIAEDAAPPAFDSHAPLMSLPVAFGTTLEKIPAETPYLHAAPEAVARWTQRFGPATGPRIGLAWSGRPSHANDRRRSIPLERLAPLIGPGVDWVSLQKDVRPEDAAIRDVSGLISDFGDTAALIDLMDLVITVDTSVAHLAGALGKPVWILLPFNADWRWLRDREDSPWYPSARLFRQPAHGDWDSVIIAVKAGLEARFAQS